MTVARLVWILFLAIGFAKSDEGTSENEAEDGEALERSKRQLNKQQYLVGK